MGLNKGKKRKPRGKPADAKIAERRIKAMELRAAGLNYRLIAAQLDISVGQAHADVMAGLQAARQKLEQLGLDLIALEWERLEQPVMHLVQLLKGGNLDPGELCQVIETIRKLSESRRKLRGLDAPNKNEITGKDGEPIKLEPNVVIYIPENGRGGVKPKVQGKTKRA